MKLPSKISPDRIKDSIIEVRYSSKLPFDILLGIFFESLDDDYTYANRPNLHSTPFVLESNVKLSISGSALFFNKKIKIEFLPNIMVFNCLESYLGWEEYFDEVKKVLVQINNTKRIESYLRIGLRYISEYPNMDIHDITKFSFSFGMPKIQSENFIFRSEFFENNFIIVLNLANNLNLIGSDNIVSKISNIDIDVIRDVNISDLDELLQIISNAHSEEKKVFFDILNERFLNELKPIY
ncbi:TIGR04255 family protein [Belliella sp. DSM 107340]|uniref:TIGR04255 family protein n=1 Tax=Belliella calami TaxID=2923436 RepID=A0ABS9UIR8_9BACT|nr:TIGR04255 family protein [Belliella calami]MCH7396506.1 TIGR04255 family protein [Belliella calami]